MLRAVPKDLPLPIRQGGGVKDWLWRDGKAGATEARLEVLLAEEHVASPAIRYRLVFGAEGGSFTVLDERVENELPRPGTAKPYFYFGYENGRPMLNFQQGSRVLQRADIDPTQSILSQRRDPEAYPELTRLADLLRGILIYRNWQFGPDSLAGATSPPWRWSSCRSSALSRQIPASPLGQPRQDGIPRAAVIPWRRSLRR